MKKDKLSIEEKYLTSKKSERYTSRQTDRRRKINKQGQTVYGREEKYLKSKKSDRHTNRQTDRRRRMNVHYKGQTVYRREVLVK